MTTLKQSTLIADIKAGKQAVLNDIYKTYRSEFLNWLKNSYNCAENDALDIFQDSIIVVYNNVKSGKLTRLTSSFKTYLFAVGRRIFLNKNQKNKLKTNSLEEYPNIDVAVPSANELNERQTAMFELLQKMREPCKSIIYLFYYKNFALESIATKLKYRSDKVVKVQKSRCMKSFKQVLAKSYGK